MFVHFVVLSFDRFMATSESTECGLVLPLASVASRGRVWRLSLFLEIHYPGKVTMWYIFHWLSTSPYSTRSNRSVHACCCTIMNLLIIICFAFQAATDIAAAAIRGNCNRAPF